MKDYIAAIFMVGIFVVCGLFAYAQTSKDINYFGSKDPPGNTTENTDYFQLRYDALGYRVIRKYALEYKGTCGEKYSIIDTYIRSHERNRPKSPPDSGRDRE